MIAPTTPGALVHPTTSGDLWRRWVLAAGLAASLALVWLVQACEAPRSL